MDLETVILSKVSQTGEILYDNPYICNLKRNDKNQLIYKTEIDSQTQRMSLRLLGRRMGRRDSWGVWDGHVHTVIFKMDNQQSPTVQHRELCSMLCGRLDGGGVWGRMDTCLGMGESLCCSRKSTFSFFIENYYNIVNGLYSSIK